MCTHTHTHALESFGVMLVVSVVFPRWFQCKALGEGGVFGVGWSVLSAKCASCSTQQQTEITSTAYCFLIALQRTRNLKVEPLNQATVASADFALHQKKDREGQRDRHTERGRLKKNTHTFAHTNTPKTIVLNPAYTINKITS